MKSMVFVLLMFAPLFTHALVVGDQTSSVKTNQAPIKEVWIEIKNQVLAEQFLLNLTRTAGTDRSAFKSLLNSFETGGYKIEEQIHPIYPAPASGIKILRLQQKEHSFDYSLKFKLVPPSEFMSSFEVTVNFVGIVHNETTVDFHPVILKLDLVNLNPIVPVPGMTGGSR